jgi:hypothetical protein
MPSNTSANMQAVNGMTAVPTQPTQQRPLHIAWEYHTRAFCTGNVDMPELLHLNHYVAVTAPANDVLGEMIGAAAGPEYTLTHAVHMWRTEDPLPVITVPPKGLAGMQSSRPPNRHSSGPGHQPAACQFSSPQQPLAISHQAPARSLSAGTLQQPASSQALACHGCPLQNDRQANNISIMLCMYDQHLPAHSRLHISHCQPKVTVGLG